MKEDKRNHKIKSDYGMNDYYKSYKSKSEKPVSKEVYSSIVKDFNSHVRKKMAIKGTEYVFPFRLGKMELRKIKTEVKIDKDGNIINKLPVNWKETNKFWEKNPEAKEKGIKIRYTNEHTDGYTFKIFYLRSKASYKNKSMYQMQFNRDMKRTLSKSIFQGKIDAFLK